MYRALRECPINAHNPDCTRARTVKLYVQHLWWELHRANHKTTPFNRARELMQLVIMTINRPLEHSTVRIIPTCQLLSYSDNWAVSKMINSVIASRMHIGFKKKTAANSQLEGRGDGYWIPRININYQALFLHQTIVTSLQVCFSDHNLSWCRFIWSSTSIYSFLPKHPFLDTLEWFCCSPSLLLIKTFKF